MSIFTAFARFMNDMVCRVVGGVAMGAAVLGVAMLVTNPDPLITAFGQDLYAAIALAGLVSLATILLLPGLTRRFFYGSHRGRTRRGMAQIAVAAAVLVLAGMVVRAAAPAADWAEASALVLQAGLAVLAVLTLTWLVPGTGLDARALGQPGGGNRRPRPADLRNLRHRRTPRQA